MIGAPTGQWALGKTIGAGSMGKVKLARNNETGEQVCLPREGALTCPVPFTDAHEAGCCEDRAATVPSGRASQPAGS